MRKLFTILLLSALSVFQSCAHKPESDVQLHAKKPVESPKPLDTDWKTQQDPLYSIDYPANWEASYIGQPGISFIAISPKDSEVDTFHENVTLLVQDLKGKNMDLQTFVDNNTREIMDKITETNFVDKEKNGKNAEKYHEVTYTGEQGSDSLIYKQRFYIHKDTGFIVIFTYQNDKSKMYVPISDKIFDSLHLK